MISKNTNQRSKTCIIMKNQKIFFFKACLLASLKPQRSRSMKQGFTLIELLIVVAIIGILSSIVIVNLSGVRTKSQNNAALAKATSILNTVQKCDLDGGKIVSPASITDGGGNICNIGSSYGTWPSPPQNWQWDSVVTTDGESDYFRTCSSGASCNGAQYQIYCGHCPGCGGDMRPGIRRMYQGFSCTLSVDGGANWE
jgi:prepilin-type N-terminal cleavage/methylation domain-containing protein